MKILLISGHGAGDPGAIGTYNGKTYKEADLTREVVNGVAKKLKECAEVTVYDQKRNAYTDYKNGTLNKNANFAQYDFVLEVHFNAFKADSGDGRTKGVEIFAKSGSSIEPAICKNISAVGFTNRGVKSNSFAVINTARSKGVRAALLEVCFIDDADDMQLYLNKKEQVVDAIVEGFGLKKVDDPLLNYKQNIKKKAGLSDATIDYLAAYKYGDDLLRKLSDAMK
jgi:N-acetylmuramoyl-L-alanine amidase